MQWITHFLYGFLIGYLALVTPGLLNMTALRTSIEVGRREGVKFASGATLVVLLQISVALVGVDYLHKHPEIIEGLSSASIFVLLALSLFFFIQAKRKVKKVKQRKANSYFYIGMVLAFINMLAIPFYFGVSVYLSTMNLLIMEQPYLYIFAISATLGTLSLFMCYIYLAEIIKKKVSFITKNINYILSILFLVLGILGIIASLK